MNMTQTRIGLIGLGVMGQNLALNIADKGYKISVYNRTFSRTEITIKRAKKDGFENRLTGFSTLQEFVQSIAQPRAIIIMVTAGLAADKTISSLLDHISSGDIIIDGGNEAYKNTEQRSNMLNEKGIKFLGMGVSGGEKGARYGPALMPGGNKEAYNTIKDILSSISEKINVDNKIISCVDYIGSGGSGHYVKMVHNGIEYAIEQILAEAWAYLRYNKFSNTEISNIFSNWNTEPLLSSYLMEISSHILKQTDTESGVDLIDVILDAAEQKGTGKWTVESALEHSVCVSSIAAAVDARIMSSNIVQRHQLNTLIQKQSKKRKIETNNKDILINLKESLIVAIIIAYTQGFSLLHCVSKKYSWDLNFSAISRVWQGGCIIRAKLLELFEKGYKDNPNTPSLLLCETSNLLENVIYNLPSLRFIVQEATKYSLPIPCLSSALTYFETISQYRGNASFIQGLRDYFGSHTYKRIDKEGIFHTKWGSEK